MPDPLLPPRDADTHKGSFGHVLAAAGSRFMPGAAVLASRAAYRTGAGLVTVLTEIEAISSIAAASPEAIFADWPALGARLALGEGFTQDVLLAGPGMGQEGHGRLFFELLNDFPGPSVIDADALNLIAANPGRLEQREDRIWTPHPGEFRRLTGESPRTDEERSTAARQFVKSHGGALVLKGHRSVIASAESETIRTIVNTTGNPGMATAGAGDVLAGILAALLAQGLEPGEAARRGTRLHGLSGDLAAAELGDLSLTASDLIDFLPRAIRAWSAKPAPAGSPDAGSPDAESRDAAARDDTNEGKKGR